MFFDCIWAMMMTAEYKLIPLCKQLRLLEPLRGLDGSHRIARTVSEECKVQFKLFFTVLSHLVLFFYFFVIIQIF
jgi:hypothetical protein